MRSLGEKCLFRVDFDKRKYWVTHVCRRIDIIFLAFLSSTLASFARMILRTRMYARHAATISPRKYFLYDDDEDQIYFLDDDSSLMQIEV